MAIPLKRTLRKYNFSLNGQWSKSSQANLDIKFINYKNESACQKDLNHFETSTLLYKKNIRQLNYNFLFLKNQIDLLKYKVEFVIYL